MSPHEVDNLLGSLRILAEWHEYRAEMSDPEAAGIHSDAARRILLILEDHAAPEPTAPLIPYLEN